MAVMTIDSDSLTDIADSIREKLGVETTYLPSEMAAAIDSITGGGGGGGEAEYILVEWIKSDGTQAIDTGEKLTAETEIYADASATNESGKYLWLFGVWPNETTGDNEWIGTVYSNGSAIVVYKMNMFVVNGSQTGVRAITSITPTTRSFRPLNGSTSSSSTGTMVASNDPMPVFGIGSYEGGEYVVKQLINATLYKFSINGKDFYPVKRVSDGAYGLYNTTDKTFHGDIMGGNPFTAGEEIGPIGGGGAGPYGYVGYRREKANPDPFDRITYLGDAIGMNPARMNYPSTSSVGEFTYGGWQEFIESVARPVMLRSDGTVDYELKHDDQTKKLDGTASDYNNLSYDGNAMVEFGSEYRWVKRYEDEDYEYVLFAKTKLDSGYHAYAHTDDSGTVQDAFYVGMQPGPYNSNVLRSMGSGAAATGQTMDTEIARAKANGTGWNIVSKSQWDYVCDLLTLIGKSDNTQAVFGNGHGIGSPSTSAKGTEACWAYGPFYGSSANDGNVKVLWLVNLWGSAWERINGLVLVNGRMFTKMTGPYMDAPSSDWDISEYTDTGYTMSGTSGNSTKVTHTDDASGYLPVSSEGSTYYRYVPDAMVYNSSGNNVPILGGGYADGNGRLGARAVGLNAPPSRTGTAMAARLSYIEESA